MSRQFTARNLNRALQRISISATIAFAVVGCQVGTDQYGRTMMSTPTLGQTLGLSQRRPGAPVLPVATNGAVQEQKIIAGKTLQITSSGNGHAIVVDGRVVANDAEDDRVMIQGVYQGGGRTYVLIAEQSGGIACPSMYQAIDLSGSVPAVSPQMGNCSDLPHMSVVAGALRVSVPAFRASLSGSRLVPAKTYLFRDGRLTG